MTKRIYWKKGMRLTDDVLRASDNSTAELISYSLALAASGRFGLFPSASPFEVSLNINKSFVDVDYLQCLAVTKDASLIDAHYDTKYTNTFDTRVQIPEGNGAKEFLLTINANHDQWKETNDGYEEPIYSFSLISPNSPLPENAMPIARIMDDFGWRMDEIDFVPPCLYLTSHQKYMDLLRQFSEVLSEVVQKAGKLLQSDAKKAISMFWPVSQQLMITVSKEYDLMTPMGLLANVQKFVSAFACACEIDDYLNLSDADKFRNYIYTPYNFKDAYLRIKEGLELCLSINEKVGEISNAQPVTKPLVAPSIAQTHRIQICSTPNTVIPIEYPNHNANIIFTTDGTKPELDSTKAKRTASGFEISFNNGFSGQAKESDREITIKLIAVENGDNSPTASYKVTLRKNLIFRDVPKI